MFQVEHSIRGDIYTVYGTKDTDSMYRNASAVDFLIYLNDKWVWRNAEYLIPINEESYETKKENI